MDYHRPTSWNDALALKAEDPTALPINGGTDVMVGINFDQIRPTALIDLSHVQEIKEWDTEGGAVRVGAGVTFTDLIEGLSGQLPGLAMASRTVGSPQIRNRGTIGGSLANSDPAADYPAAVLGLGATIRTDQRAIAADDWFRGMFDTALDDGELIVSVSFPKPKRAAYARVVAQLGTRPER